MLRVASTSAAAHTRTRKSLRNARPQRRVGSPHWKGQASPPRLCRPRCLVGYPGRSWKPAGLLLYVCVCACVGRWVGGRGGARWRCLNLLRAKHASMALPVCKQLPCLKCEAANERTRAWAGGATPPLSAGAACVADAPFFEGKMAMRMSCRAPKIAPTRLGPHTKGFPTACVSSPC